MWRPRLVNSSSRPRGAPRASDARPTENTAATADAADATIAATDATDAAPAAPAAATVTAARTSQGVAWLLLGVIAVAAAVQGSDFASTKPTATAWGALIGVAAFFGWLAVDIEEEASGADEDDAWPGEEEDDDDDDEVEEKPAQPDGKAHEKAE